MPINDDPFAPWNNPMYQDDPFAAHNNPMESDNPFKPWNEPFGSVNDLNDRERESYRIPPKRRYEEDGNDRW